MAAVPPPHGGDWTKVVTQSPAGGFMMGNPNAAVKLVEYASMTCPHCAQFHNVTLPELKTKYIDTGKVRFIFREFPLDPLAAAETVAEVLRGLALPVVKG